MDSTSGLHHADWGIRQWVPFLVDLLLDGDSITTEMVMSYLLGEVPILPAMVLS